ncbi:MAG TPA: hypothetical protein VNK96_04530 [Fimbriimonadales bacterium]|nr:hypothetical protein [Fimbriimonadales bacterium]
MINKKKVVVLSVAAIVVVVAAVLIIKHFFFQETLDQAARRVLQAMQNFDAGTLMSYVSDEEKELANLSEDKLQRFFDEFVKPHLKGFRPVGQVEVLTFTIQGGLNMTQKYQHPDGRTTYLNSFVMITEKGIKTLNLTRFLYLWALFTEWPAGKPYPRGQEKMQFYADTTLKYKERLEKTGLRGIVEVEGKDLTRKFYTWDELAQMYLALKKEIAESSGRRKREEATH